MTVKKDPDMKSLIPEWLPAKASVPPGEESYCGKGATVGDLRNAGFSRQQI